MHVHCLFMHVSMYVCMYVCVYVCMYVCACVCVCVYVCIHAHAVYMYTYLLVTRLMYTHVSATASNATVLQALGARLSATSFRDEAPGSRSRELEFVILSCEALATL